MRKVREVKSGYVFEPDVADLLVLSLESEDAAWRASKPAERLSNFSISLSAMKSVENHLEEIGHPNCRAVFAALHPLVIGVAVARRELEEAVRLQLHLYRDDNGKAYPKGPFHMPNLSSDA